MSDQFQFTPPFEDGGQGTDPDDVASGFLKNVSEEHRPIVGQYLPAWQSGVTKRFQAIHDEFRPWKEFSENYDTDTVAQALAVWDMLDSDPKRVYELLADIGTQQGWNAPSGQQAPPEPQAPDWQKNMPPEFMSKIDQMEKVLMALGQETVSQRQARADAEQDQQLESYMGWLKKEYGTFDEDYVLMRMSNGMDGPTAVKSYNDFVNQIRGSNGNGGRPTPRVLSGAGSVPVDRQPDFAKMSSADVRKNIVSLLEQGRQS